MRVLLLALVLLGGCLSAPDEPQLLDKRLGIAQTDSGWTIELQQTARVDLFEPGQLHLRALAPIVEGTITAPSVAVPATWTLTITNAMPETVLTIRNAAGETSLASNAGVFELSFDVVGPHQLELASPDAATAEPFSFAVMSDVQNRLPEVSDVIEAIASHQEVRFLLSTGDIAERGTRSEFDAMLRELEALGVPFYSTIGNHDIVGDLVDWHETFGPMSFGFEFKGVAFTAVDSSRASIAPGTVFHPPTAAGSLSRQRAHLCHP